MTLPLQTGNAIIGARVLSADAGAAAGERAAAVALANEPGARAGRARRRQTPTSTSTSSFTSADAQVKESAEATGGKEVVGGELLSTADWAPQDNVDGVHVTDAAKR